MPLDGIIHPIGGRSPHPCVTYIQSTRNQDMLWFSLAHTQYIGGTCAVPPWSQEASGSRTDLLSKSIIPVSVRPFIPRKDKSNRWPLNYDRAGQMPQRLSCRFFGFILSQARAGWCPLSTCYYDCTLPSVECPMHICANHLPRAS
jgi:hypothetical protein